MISFRTDQHHKKISKAARWKALITVNVCLVIMCALVFGASAFVVRANAANYTDEKVLSYSWYDLSEDGRILNLHLDNEMNGYFWKYGTSNEAIRELTFLEMTDAIRNNDESYDWNAHFTPESNASGDVVLTLQHVLDGNTESIDTRTLSIHVEDGVMSLR